MSYYEQMTARMAEAVSADKYVVIQPAFGTIPEKHEPRLSNLRESKGLGDIFGQAAAEWQQRHYDQHEVFRVGSLERLISVAKAFKGHTREGEVTIDRLLVSKHRCLIPWSSFYPDVNEAHEDRTHRSPETLHVRQVFEAMLGNVRRQPYRNLVPALAPVLRTNLSGLSAHQDKPLKPYHISTNSIRNMRVNGEAVRVRDMLIVKDQELKERIEDASSFSLVATPFLQRWSIVEGVESAKKHRLSGYKSPIEDVKPMCVFWQIGTDAQLSFD